MKAATHLHVPSSCQSPIVYTFYLADNPAPPAVWKAVLLSRLPAGSSAWKPEITNGSPVADWEKPVSVNLFWMGSVLNNASAIACFVWLTDWLLALLQGHCYWAVPRRSWWETGEWSRRLSSNQSLDRMRGRGGEGRRDRQVDEGHQSYCVSYYLGHKGRGSS